MVNIVFDMVSDYEDIPSINPEINVMKGLTCLRLNGNKLQR